MTIPELLVKDGRWPDTRGPRDNSKKPIDFTWTVKLDGVQVGVGTDYKSFFSFDPDIPSTITCTVDEQGVKV